MIIAGFISLLVFDVIILYFFLKQNKERSSSQDTLSSIYEERQLFNQQKEVLHEELHQSVASCKRYHDQITSHLMEFEIELKEGVDTVRKEVELRSAEMMRHFESPMAEIQKRTSALDFLIRKVETEKKSLLDLLNRTERLIEFFDEKKPYEHVLSELQNRKYQDARKLLTQGKNFEEIASLLDLSLSEVKMIVGVSL